MATRPNPIREDGVVLMHFVPVPSVDTPEEILEHYRHWWGMCDIRAARMRNRLPVHIDKDTPGYKEWYEAYQLANQAKREFDLVNCVVSSYRCAAGNGTMGAVEGRHGGHVGQRREIPLTNPGPIHLFVEGRRYNILCEDDANSDSSAVLDINHVDCPHCLRGYWLTKRWRKRKHRHEAPRPIPIAELAWNQYVKDTILLPRFRSDQVDAKEFYRFYDQS